VGVRQLVSRCYEVVGMAKTCHDSGASGQGSGALREAAGTVQALPAEPAFRDLIELVLDFEAP
jgi:hypothetical protein